MSASVKSWHSSSVRNSKYVDHFFITRLVFFQGWNMILEYVIGEWHETVSLYRRMGFLGAASTARALSSYLDSLMNFAMKDYFTVHFPLHSGTFAPYADLFAMSLCLAITGKAFWYEIRIKSNPECFSSFPGDRYQRIGRTEQCFHICQSLGNYHRHPRRSDKDRCTQLEYLSERSTEKNHSFFKRFEARIEIMFRLEI